MNRNNITKSRMKKIAKPILMQTTKQYKPTNLNQLYQSEEFRKNFNNNIKRYPKLYKFKQEIDEYKNQGKKIPKELQQKFEDKEIKQSLGEAIAKSTFEFQGLKSLN